MVLMDAVWIGLIARKFYVEKIGFLMQGSMQFVPAVIFYLIYAVALVVLVVMPALASQSWQEALWRGALLGLAAYAAYDLTNQATIANWPLVVTLVDMAWGTFVTATASTIAYFILNFFK